MGQAFCELNASAIQNAAPLKRMKIIRGKWIKNKMHLNESLDSEELDAMMLQMIEAYQILQKTNNISEHPINGSKEKITEVETTIVEVLQKVTNDIMVLQAQDKEISLLWQCIAGTAILFCVLGGILGGLTMHYL